MPDGSLSKNGPPALLVTESSASQIGLAENFHDHQALDTDHSGLVKFDHSQNPNYLKVKHRIQKLVENASQVVHSRFFAEEGQFMELKEGR